MATLYDRFRRRNVTTAAPEYKILGGKRYRLVATDTDKDAAKDEADYYRSSGDRARVVKVAGDWCVYARSA